MTANSAPHSQGVTLKRALGIPALIIFGLAYMVPLTVFTTYGQVTSITEGHLPAAYLITLVAMLLTACSYAVLVREIPRAGSAYTYARKAFGGHVGFLTGWTLMLDYLFLPLINYLLIGIYLNAQFTAVPIWVFTLASILIVTALNIVGISIVKNANLFLVGVQLVFVAVFLVVAVVYAANNPGASLLQPLYDTGMSIPALASGAAVIALSFLGFDAISTLSEEAKDARRTVPRAILITTVLGGLIFTAVAYAGHIIQPAWQDMADPDAAAVEIMRIAAGQWLEIFFLVAYIAGCVAAAMASQVSVSRILYAMGRDGVLPKRLFGAFSERFRTPIGATIFVAVVSLLALVVDLATIASLISFGALAAFSLVNLSVVKFFLFDRKERGGKAVLVYGVLPILGFAMTVWLWTSLSGLALVVGLSWFAIGLVYLAFLTRGFRRQPPEIDFEAENAALDAEHAMTTRAPIA
ncbi:Putrescine importer PuuP [Pseudoclavibacter sp. RFBG4]|uniref:APC family permease n=1 Tax=Pseudoclavibacter sp. RFBG4 TaxID=2080575 RepID=UPI000CE8D6CC|nr:APC family permease [Pseudoclavibacter sp. RFBG4]PPG26593.1 Putrescine importer PuuP [Pseudoclavibacter sp. RFBG4]